MRPADPSSFGEDETLWLERAREAASLGPLGHHTHWTAPDHARPTGGGTGRRVSPRRARLREHGLTPTLFCGGGWYTDEGVADSCAELGYVGCRCAATSGSLGASDGRHARRAPAVVDLPSGGLLRAIPTTHSLGDLARASPPRRELPGCVHVYFHDTDLLGLRRRALLRVALPVLARRARVTDLDALSACTLAYIDPRDVGRRGAALTSTGCRAPRSLRRPRCHVGRRRRPSHIATSERRASTCSREARRCPFSGALLRSSRSSFSTSSDSLSGSISHSSSARWSQVTETFCGGSCGARTGRAEFAAPITVLVFRRGRASTGSASCTSGSRENPCLPHRRRAHRARIRDRNGLRLLDVGPHPDVGGRVCGGDQPLRAAYESASLEVMRAAGISRRVVLVGAGESLVRLRASLEVGRSGLSYEFVGVVAPEAVPGFRLLGSRAELPLVLDQLKPDEVILTGERTSTSEPCSRSSSRRTARGSRSASHPTRDGAPRAARRVRSRPGSAALRTPPARAHRLGLGGEARLRPPRERTRRRRSSCPSGRSSRSRSSSTRAGRSSSSIAASVSASATFRC